MRWLERLEQKFGRFTIPHLIRYIVFAKALVCIFSLIVYSLLKIDLLSYLYLDPQLVLKGQVWRLVTFLFVQDIGLDLLSILKTAIFLYFYYFVGTTLENHWGSFRFNLYYFIGVLAAIASSFLFNLPGTDDYIFETLFFAFATLYPELKVLVFYFIPIKVKWLGLISAILLGLNIALALISGDFAYMGYIAISCISYVVFFLPYWIEKIKNKQRRDSFAKRTSDSTGTFYTSGFRTTSAAKSPKDVSAASVGKGNQKPLHRCYICGLTDLDDPNMTFRYCNVCDGAYEYCANHIQNHTHIKN